MVHIKKRIKAHNEGKGAKYTNSRRPVKLQYTESYQTKSEALKREYEIKQLTRLEKQKLFKKNKVWKSGHNEENHSRV